MSDVLEFLTELDAGVFEQKLARTLLDVAQASMQHNKCGEITLKFKVTPINNSQVKVVHDIESKAPTMHGVKIEKNKTNSHLYVSTQGKMSMFPENQTQMFSKSGQVPTTQDK